MTTRRRKPNGNGGGPKAGRKRAPKHVSPLAAERWAVVQKIVGDGRCRDCGKPRGAKGTSQHCAACKEKHNARQRARYQRAFKALRASESS